MITNACPNQRHLSIKVKQFTNEMQRQTEESVYKKQYLQFIKSGCLIKRHIMNGKSWSQSCKNLFLKKPKTNR